MARVSKPKSIFSIDEQQGELAKLAGKSASELASLFSNKLAEIIGLLVGGEAQGHEYTIANSVVAYFQSIYGNIIAKKGSVYSAEQSAKYVAMRKKGMPQPQNNSYRGDDGQVYTLVSLSSIGMEVVDFDPLNRTQQLFDGNGTGNIIWGTTPTDVRQFFALVVQMGELRPSDPHHLKSVRADLRAEKTIEELGEDYPATMARWNELDENDRPKVRGKLSPKAETPAQAPSQVTGAPSDDPINQRLLRQLEKLRREYPTAVSIYELSRAMITKHLVPYRTHDFNTRLRDLVAQTLLLDGKAEMFLRSMPDMVRRPDGKGITYDPYNYHVDLTQWGGKNGVTIWHVLAAMKVIADLDQI